MVVDGRQFDTVYGKHILVAITSRGKQASLQREVGDASVVGESERVDGEELLANPLLLLPPLSHHPSFITLRPPPLLCPL
ncbi:hypothetical protein K0M31_017690 [Melipona bicolor]|uniref:Uncharacterized protein n=1 Tax=Melipona bicolor TaxID=60889 RepID=A0AA40G5C5_9HYME|nr:hypothetical protein K0M31_017690 [Melipona bicolor]